ncbi:hypothetical protein EG829_18855 [bacterium]|nr:hypothetical protein [bacterium]
MISIRRAESAMGRLVLVGALMVPLLVLSLDDRSQAEENGEQPQQLEQGQEPMEGQAAPPPVDPLVGNWFCTNNALSYNIFFQANGQLVAGEAFLGNSRSNTWIRLSEDRIAIPGGPRFEIQFDDPDNFSYREMNIGSTGTCKRQ